MPHYLAVLTPCRPTLAQDATEAELQIVGEHFAHLETRCAAGALTIAGRTEGGEMGVMVFSANSDAEADAFVQNDPAVRSGLMSAERYTFRLALWGEPTG